MRDKNDYRSGNAPAMHKIDLKQAAVLETLLGDCVHLSTLFYSAHGHFQKFPIGGFMYVDLETVTLSHRNR